MPNNPSAQVATVRQQIKILSANYAAEQDTTKKVKLFFEIEKKRRKLDLWLSRLVRAR